MQKLKLLIAESNFEEKTKLADCCNKWEQFKVLVADCGKSAIEIAEKEKPEVVICNFALKNTDGITLCEKLKALGDTKIVMLSSAFSDTVVKRMIECGVDYYMLRPFDEKALKKQVELLTKLALEKTKPETKAAQVVGTFPPIATKQLEERISNIFITMGIPAHIKGYQFLREAIKIIIEYPTMIGGITKELYPTIAKHFSTTPSKVERAIRHAIEVGWNRGRINQINEIFKVRAFDPNDRPTNGEFIALVADKLLLEGVS